MITFLEHMYVNANANKEAFFIFSKKNDFIYVYFISEERSKLKYTTQSQKNIARTKLTLITN